MENQENKLSFLPSLLIRLSTIKNDLALQAQARGARKLVVTEIFTDKEEIAQNSVWKAPEDREKCPVLQTNDFEVSVFNQEAKQDRHFHKLATEIYLVIEGKMVMEIEHCEYILFPGDSIIINPNSVHLVKSCQEQFLCYVFSFNCAGISDKYLVIN